MTAAYRLRGLGWFASCSAIVLGFYLVSLQVASERNRLDALNARIRAAERDVRALETEFDTRANLQQLERWNGDVLALSSPTAGQFVRDGQQLASLRADAPVPAAAGEVRMQTAALVVPAYHSGVPAPAAPAPAPAVAPVRDPAAPVRVAAATPAKVPAGGVGVAPARPVPQRVAMLDRELLSRDTFGDLVSGARAEAAGRPGQGTGRRR